MASPIALAPTSCWSRCDEASASAEIAAALGIKTLGVGSGSISMPTFGSRCEVHGSVQPSPKSSFRAYYVLAGPEVPTGRVLTNALI